MKKITFLLLLTLASTIIFAQKKEKVKGSKIVTTERKKIGSFDQIEAEDNLEIFLVKGDKSALEVETDDNLHSAVDYKLYGTVLRLNTNKEISSFKKLEVRITYTDSLKLISSKHETKINAPSGLALSNITVKTSDYSKAYLNVDSPNFSLIANDKSKVELNLKSDDASIEMSKNSELKALVTANKLKVDLYQKADATIEGTTNDMKLRLDNNASYNGQKLTSKSLNLTTESYTKCAVNTNGNLSITASGKSEVDIYGDPKIEIKKFGDDAILRKKSK